MCTSKALLVLAQALGQGEFGNFDDDGLPVGMLFSWLPGQFGSFGWLYVVFLIWMAVYCIRNDPERSIWMWIILIFQPLGAIIYFFVRWAPSSSLQPPRWIQRFFRSRELQRKQIAASQIGNAHQHVELGDALREFGQLDEASAAYANAIAKDPRHLAALWGAASVDYQRGRFAEAREKLSHVLAIDPAYKFGDVSLLYANTLLKLNEHDAAREHLEQHTRRWRHPESLYRLAEIRAQSDPQGARELLQGLIMDVDASPRAIARKFYFWKGRARRLLRRIPGN
ncbi:MAG: tetratricopeptide repeat protein [Planctomyces sp.]|nr:tetratricopeptide repeat protein [Planctomyces sp.]